MVNSTEQKLTEFAKKIVDRGMAVPSIFFLEMGKYASFIGSQTLVFFGPIITAFVKSEKYYNFAEILEDRNNIEFLLQEIERLSLSHSKLKEKN
tara:strand:+ start:74 stop:355 length:282 start_codon:yes stop_codon:yes gene_type:complete